MMGASRPAGRHGSRTARWLAVVLWVALVAAGCGWKKAQVEAETAVARHFDAVAHHSSALVLDGYDATFFSVTPRDQWGKRLRTIEAKLGDFQSFKVVNWNVQSKVGTDAGTYVMLTCQVSYSKYPAEERMLMFRRSDDDAFKIVKHGINSEGFMQE